MSAILEKRRTNDSSVRQNDRNQECSLTRDQVTHTEGSPQSSGSGHENVPEKNPGTKPKLLNAILIALDMQSSAHERRKMAKQHRKDAVRNLACAAALDEMAKRLFEYGGGPALDEYEAILDDPEGDGGLFFVELEMKETQSIHFVARDAEDFFRYQVESYNAEYSAQ